MAAATAPLVVLFHELAHVFVLEGAGIDARLYGFSMGMPVGYSWDFRGLEEAASFYHINGRAIAYAALAGPLVTLFIAVGGLSGYRYENAHSLGGALSALALRMMDHGIYAALPDGTMSASASDRCTFSRSATVLVLWPSLVLGHVSIFLLCRVVRKVNGFRSRSAMMGNHRLPGVILATYWSLDLRSGAGETTDLIYPATAGSREI
jgi:hypothetical protein